MCPTTVDTLGPSHDAGVSTRPRHPIEPPVGPKRGLCGASGRMIARRSGTSGLRDEARPAQTHPKPPPRGFSTGGGAVYQAGEWGGPIRERARVTTAPARPAILRGETGWAVTLHRHPNGDFVCRVN